MKVSGNGIISSPLTAEIRAAAVPAGSEPGADSKVCNDHSKAAVCTTTARLKVRHSHPMAFDGRRRVTSRPTIAQATTATGKTMPQKPRSKVSDSPDAVASEARAALSWRPTSQAIHRIMVTLQRAQAAVARFILRKANQDYPRASILSGRATR